MDHVTISQASPGDPELLEFIARHSEFCAANTPAGSGHAIPPEAVSRQDEESPRASVRFWMAQVEGRPVGCIGLRKIDSTHAEIKTLHVLSHARGSGLGERLVLTLCNAAKKSGVRRLSLETGRSEGFAPSRALYARMQFQPCEPFGPYAGDPFSYCMTLELQP